MVVVTLACGNTHGGGTRGIGKLAGRTRASTGRVNNPGASSTGATFFVRATATVGDNSVSRIIGGIARSAGTFTVRVGQGGVVDIGTGTTICSGCRHEDIVADFDKLDAVDFNLFTVGERGNSAGGSVGGFDQRGGHRVGMNVRQC